MFETLETRQFLSATLTTDPAPTTDTSVQPSGVNADDLARKAGKCQTEFMKITLKEVIVTSVHPGGSGGDGYLG
jgi:hypothetical protein